MKLVQNVLICSKNVLTLLLSKSVTLVHKSVHEISTFRTGSYCLIYWWNCLFWGWAGQANIWSVAVGNQFKLALHTQGYSTKTRWVWKRMLLRHTVTLVGGSGSGMRSKNVSFVTWTVAAIPKALLHEHGCGPIVEVFPEPGILLTNLRILSVRRLGMSCRGAREHTTSRTSERGPASTSRQIAVVEIPAASIALWIDAYGVRATLAPAPAVWLHTVPLSHTRLQT